MTPELKAKKTLIKLARAAWVLADGTEGTSIDGQYLVDKKDFDLLCKHLDTLEKLPELPPPYVGEGPAKAESAIGLRKP